MRTVTVYRDYIENAEWRQSFKCNLH